MRHRARFRPRWSHLPVAAVVSAAAAFVVATVAAPATGSPAPAGLPLAPTAKAGPTTATAAPTTAVGATTTASVAAGPIGFAAYQTGTNSLRTSAVVTKRKGGVVVTVTVVNARDTPVTVSAAGLGPDIVTFRGAHARMESLPAVVKTLVPGEAYVYPCSVTLPDMSSGELAFDVAGVHIAGQAAGD